ncbi:MAG: ABC transporter permease [Eubacteriales bacterium]
MLNTTWNRAKPVLVTLLLSTTAILLSLVVAGVIMLAVGYDPLNAYAVLFDSAFGSVTSLANTLSKTVPLLFAGLSVAFAYKCGLFNIGGEGQLYMGAFVSTVVALALGDLPSCIMIPTIIIVSFIGGGAVGALNGYMKAKLGLNEVIVAIMLNYIVTFFVSYFLNGPMAAVGSMTPQSEVVPDSALFATIVPKTQLTTALYLGLAVAVILFFFFKYTRAGYNIRAVGQNPTAAQAAGVSITMATVSAMGVSGGIAGLVGMTEVFGKYGRLIDGFSPGFGFTGIAVAVLASCNPFAILLTSILFGALEAGSMKMSYSAGVSTNMVMVIQGLVILFVATPNIVRGIFRMKEGK